MAVIEDSEVMSSEFLGFSNLGGVCIKLKSVNILILIKLKYF